MPLRWRSKGRHAASASAAVRVSSSVGACAERRQHAQRFPGLQRAVAERRFGAAGQRHVEVTVADRAQRFADRQRRRGTGTRIGLVRPAQAVADRDARRGRARHAAQQRERRQAALVVQRGVRGVDGFRRPRRAADEHAAIAQGRRAGRPAGVVQGARRREQRKACAAVRQQLFAAVEFGIERHVHARTRQRWRMARHDGTETAAGFVQRGAEFGERGAQRRDQPDAGDDNGAPAHAGALR